MKQRFGFLLLVALIIGLISGCDATSRGTTTTIIDPDQVPSTERGALAADNRFFFIGGKSLYELLPQPNGSYEYQTVVQRSDCDFTGLAAAGTTLYAACTATGPSAEMGGQTLALPAWSDLVRIDLRLPASDPGRMVATRLGDSQLFPNGMAVDEKGDIYITNTFALIFRLLNLFSPDTIPAIVRVRVAAETPFAIEKSTVLPAVQGGLEPNGIQIRGDRLWFVSMNALYEAQITSTGLKNLKTLYQADTRRVFDDFAVLPGNILAIAEIPTPITLMAIFFPNTWPPSYAPSQLTFVSTDPGPNSSSAGQVVRRHILDADITPSSATTITDAQGQALYVTDFFFGGVYRVAVD